MRNRQAAGIPRPDVEESRLLEREGRAVEARGEVVRDRQRVDPRERPAGVHGPLDVERSGLRIAVPQREDPPVARLRRHARRRRGQREGPCLH